MDRPFEVADEALCRVCLGPTNIISVTCGNACLGIHGLDFTYEHERCGHLNLPNMGFMNTAGLKRGSYGSLQGTKVSSPEANARVSSCVS